jgi:hypothetical protein
MEARFIMVVVLSHRRGRSSIRFNPRLIDFQAIEELDGVLRYHFLYLP